MKKDLERVNISIDITERGQILKAVEEIVQKIKSGHYTGTGFGGDYFNYKYSVYDASIEKEKDDVSSENMAMSEKDIDKFLKNNKGARLMEENGVRFILVPSKMNFDE